MLQKPFGQRQVRIVENGSRRGAKLVVALVTSYWNRFAMAVAAYCSVAGNFTRPAQMFNVAAAFGFIAESFD